MRKKKIKKKINMKEINQSFIQPIIQTIKIKIIKDFTLFFLIVSFRE
jgi:hypothetical protein